MSAVVGLLLCCECDPLDCDDLPETVTVNWTGQLTLESEPCDCDGNFGVCNTVGDWDAPGSATWVATLVPGVPGGFPGECVYEHDPVEETSGPFDWEVLECPFDTLGAGPYCGGPVPFDVTVQLNATGPTRDIPSGKWRVDILISWSNDAPIVPPLTSCPPGAASLGCMWPIPSVSGTALATFYGPSAGRSPVGTYVPGPFDPGLFIPPDTACVPNPFVTLLDDVGTVTVS